MGGHFSTGSLPLLSTSFSTDIVFERIQSLSKKESFPGFSVGVISAAHGVRVNSSRDPVTFALSRWMPDQVRHDDKSHQLLRPPFRRMPESSDFL
jgi:hypothetical protein